MLLMGYTAEHLQLCTEARVTFMTSELHVSHCFTSASASRRRSVRHKDAQTLLSVHPFFGRQMLVHEIALWPAAGVDPYEKDAQAPSELVSFTSSFHGRTLGALVLTYKVQILCTEWHGNGKRIPHFTSSFHGLIFGPGPHIQGAH